MVEKFKALLETALEKNPEDDDLRIYKARALIAESTKPAFTQAQEILEQVTKNNPNRTDAWSLLAEIALKRGKLSDVTDITYRGLVYKPNDKNLLLLKSQAEAARSPALSIPTLKALTEYYPYDFNLILQLADRYITSEQYDKAIELLEKPLPDNASAPAKLNAKTMLAAALYKSGRKQEAQDIFDSVAKSDPDDPMPLIAQVRLLREDQQTKALFLKIRTSTPLSQAPSGKIYTSFKYWCTKRTAMEPSPTLAATRFVEPERTSPAAKIPGTLVSSKYGSRLRFQEGGYFPF